MNNLMASSKSNNNSGSSVNNGGSKGWFEGTMEVISGMDVISGLAPRPSTPVTSSALKKRAGNNNARGSISAPSSPARSGASAFIPLINRLPSQDSMDRSIHNESSTHGKSASQIIRELKQSNASLSAKTATIEADFMNQLNHQNRKAEDRQRRLEETLKKSERMLAALEGRCKASELSLREKEEQLTKLREEGAFQRHTISDLKNQLHHRELEQEESASENPDDIGKWQVEKMHMEQEMEDLRAQVQDSQVLQQEVERLSHKLENLKISSVGSSGGDDDSVHSHLGSSQRSSYTNRSFMKQSLPHTRDFLKKTKHRLSVTEAALDILKQERTRMMQEHQMEVEELQQQLKDAGQAHQERVEALQKTIEMMKQENEIEPRESCPNIDPSADESTNGADESAMKTQPEPKLEAANQQIDYLQRQLHQYVEQVNELSSKLDKVRADAENQEQYRADEAEDLRVLHDAQEEEIERLRKELDDVSRELELRDQELEEQKLASSPDVAKKDGATSETTTTEDVAANGRAAVDRDVFPQPSFDVDVATVADLKQRLLSSEVTIAKLETQLDTKRKEHHERVEQLEGVLNEVTKGKQDAEEQLAQLSALLVAEQDPPTSDASRSLKLSMEGAGELRLLPQDRGAAVDLSIMLRNVEQLQLNERKAVSRAKELEYVQSELEQLRNSRQSETQELEELVTRLKESEEKLASTRDGAMEEYRAEIQKLRGQLKSRDSQRVLKLDEQLRESQIALGELRNEKAVLVEEHAAKMSQLQEDKKSIQEQLDTVNDEKKATIESQTKTMRQLEKEKRLLEEDFQAYKAESEKEVVLLQQTTARHVAEQERLVEQVKSYQQEKENLVRSHMETLDRNKEEQEKIETQLLDQLQANEAELSVLNNITSLSSTGEPTSDSDQMALLKQEVEKLQKQLIEEQVKQQQRQSTFNEADSSREHQSVGALEADLRKQLETMQREKEEETCHLKEKLEDRDTTISALVKSSVGLEQKISELSSALAVLQKEQNPGSTNADDVGDLQEALSDYKEVETRLIHELSLTKKQLKFAESEIARLQEVMDEEVSCDSQHYRRQIQERDDAVSALVQQSMTQETAMRKLQDRLQNASQEAETLRSEKQRAAIQLRAELRRLHQESEIFAGQIIEQDEELETLRAELHNRDEKIAALNRQLKTARGPNYRPSSMVTPDGDSPEVVSLKAQIDELEEANETYRTELRELRFKLRDYDNLRNELARVRVDLEDAQRQSEAEAGGRVDLEAAVAGRQQAEQKLEELLASKEANSQACDLLARERDALVAQRDKVIEDLRRNIDGCTSQIEALETEIDKLHEEMKEGANTLEAAEKKVQELEADVADLSHSVSAPEDNHKTKALFEEVEDLQQQLKALENENIRLSSFKEKMEHGEVVEDQSSKLAEDYNRKLSLIASDKDSIIDSLQKSLMEMRGQAQDEFEAMTRENKKHELENQTLRQEMQAVLEDKDNRIFALEQTLEAQEQLVGNMRNEMDHLQGSMVNTAYSRKEEIEDMEREVIDLSTKNASFEREITSLKIQLEDNKLAHMAEVAKLRETVDRISHEAPTSPFLKQKSPSEDFPIHEVKERLEKLRWRNNSIQEENFKLKSRLERAEAEIQTARNEKYRTANLEAKVGALTKQLEQLERENHIARKSVGQVATFAPVKQEKETLLPVAKMTPPQSPQRSNSRSGTPLRFTRQSQRQQESHSGSMSLPGSRTSSRQSTPQRKRTPLRARPNAQKQDAPDTPSGRKRGFFGFRKKSDRENALVPAGKQYLVPPSNQAIQGDKSMRAPMSNRSIQSS